MGNAEQGKACRRMSHVMIYVRKLATHDALGAVEGLDDSGDAGKDLSETDPEEELLHSSLLDGKVVELHHGSASELLLEEGEGVEILQTDNLGQITFTSS